MTGAPEAPRQRVDHWTKSPSLVKAMFREAYTEILEPKKFNLPFKVNIDEITMEASRVFDVLEVFDLRVAGEQEAKDWVYGKKKSTDEGGK